MQVLTVALQWSPNGAFIFFLSAAQLWRYSRYSLPPFCSFSLSPPSACALLPPPPPQSLLDWWSKHRKRAGSVLPRQSRGWAFLRSSCAGVKSLLWFSFHLSSANHRDTLMRMNSDPSEEVPLKRPSDASFTTAPYPTSHFTRFFLSFNRKTESSHGKSRNAISKRNYEAANNQKFKIAHLAFCTQ